MLDGTEYILLFHFASTLAVSSRDDRFSFIAGRSSDAMTLVNPMDKTGKSQVKNARDKRLLRSSDDAFENWGCRILVLSRVSAATRSNFTTTSVVKIIPTASFPGIRDCVLARAASSIELINRKADVMKEGRIVVRYSQYVKILSRILATKWIVADDMRRER
jgi:hypothetical protein